MGKNMDWIATVSIDIASPIVDDANFDNLCIVGSLPKILPEKMPPKVGAFSSLDEVLEAGWSIDADTADHIGLAAQVAFAQSPPPSVIYIAPQQFTANAEEAKRTITAINAVLEEYVGKKEGLTGCSIEFIEQKRTISVRLTGAVSSVKNTGVFEALKAAQNNGFIISIDGVPVKDGKDFTEFPVFEKLLAIAKGDAPTEFILTAKSENGPDVQYGVIVHYPKNKTDIAEPTLVLNTPQEEIESAVATLKRAVGTAGWYVACTAGVPDSEYEEIAAYMETQEKMFAYTETKFFDGDSDEPKPTVGNVYFRTLGVYGKVSSSQTEEEMPPANRYINVAFVAKWLNYSSGSETSAFKTLTSVYPSEITTTEKNLLEKGNLNYFVKVGNKNITMNGKVVGDEWADLIRFRDWLKNDMQLRVVNLFITSPKVPYTDSGIALVQNQMLASLKAGQEAGGIAETEYDEDGNAIPGYVTSVPRASSLTDSERASRKLRKCNFKARIAGAIHFAELKGTLAYSL